MANTHENYVFPQALNQPRRLFGLQIDEAVSAIFCIIIAVVTSYYVTCIAAALGVVFGLKSLKRGRPAYFLYDFLYWYLPTYVNGRFFKKLPKSYLRVWVR